MLGVLEPEFVGNLTDGLVAAEHLVLGQVYDLALDMFLCCLAGFFLYQVSEIVGGKADLVSEIFYGRQTLGLGPAAFEIVVQQFVEADQYALVGIAPGNELPVVKSHTVVEKQFDVHRYKPFAMLVYRTADFHPYFVEAVLEKMFLVFGKMEGFGRIVREEGISADIFSQGSPSDKVWMEDQTEYIRFCYVRITVYCYYLTRGETGYSAFLIVVWLSTVSYVPAFDLFQEQCVDTIVNGTFERQVLSGLVQIHRCDKGVEGLQSVEFVVLVYSVDLDDAAFFHDYANAVCLQMYGFCSESVPVRHLKQ